MSLKFAYLAQKCVLIEVKMRQLFRYLCDLFTSTLHETIFTQ